MNETALITLLYHNWNALEQISGLKWLLGCQWDASANVFNDINSLLLSQWLSMWMVVWWGRWVCCSVSGYPAWAEVASSVSRQKCLEWLHRMPWVFVGTTEVASLRLVFCCRVVVNLTVSIVEGTWDLLVLLLLLLLFMLNTTCIIEVVILVCRISDIVLLLSGTLLIAGSFLIIIMKCVTIYYFGLFCMAMEPK